MPKKLNIQDMFKIAEDRGGKCLSRIYTNSQTEIEWECAEGHRWWAKPAKIRYGQWCRKCSGSLKKTIEEMKELAIENGGRCLSIVYKNNHALLKWQCNAKGHIFESSFSSIKRAIENGGFCSKCGKTRGAAKRKLSIEELQKIAKSREGNLLSNKYINAHTLLEWQCNNGHVFRMSANSVKNDHWCRDCRFNINEAKCRFILEKLTAKPFKSNKRILKGLELDGYNSELNLGFEYNGIQHYQFIKFFHKTEEDFIKRRADDKRKQKMCNELGINLIIIPYTLENDESLFSFICEKLDELKVKIIMSKEDFNMKDFYKHFSKLRELREIAKQRGGTLLSNEYFNNKTKLKWKCHLQHIWEARPNDIKSGQWCAVCRGSHKLTIEEMKRIALARGGKCLSETYTNNRTKLQWQCSEGHQWFATPDGIKLGKWCERCRKKSAASKRKLTIEEMHIIASERGGICLSDKYINSQTHLIWKCEIGHVWSAKPNNIKSGTWCPNCKNKKS
ncbi:hypothetical protein [Domibacillus tundrae]|uniref:hypothetical protein n=1 Tax=Domibacillus tundrae TaxID=1587527 RepID=UPI000696BB90|nr:hypothetical protein [Domibacillus tundrae]